GGGGGGRGQGGGGASGGGLRRRAAGGGARRAAREAPRRARGRPLRAGAARRCRNRPYASRFPRPVRARRATDLVDVTRIDRERRHRVAILTAVHAKVNAAGGDAPSAARCATRSAFAGEAQSFDTGVAGALPFARGRGAGGNDPDWPPSSAPTASSAASKRSSRTRMGASTRSARAIASLGRTSISTDLPRACSTSVA